MQNKSVISCAGAVGKGMMVWEVRERDMLRVNKKWGLNVGSPKSDTSYHVGVGGGRGGTYTQTSTWALMQIWMCTQAQASSYPFRFLLAISKKEMYHEKKDRETCWRRLCICVCLCGGLEGFIFVCVLVNSLDFNLQVTNRSPAHVSAWLIFSVDFRYSRYTGNNTQ